MTGQLSFNQVLWTFGKLDTLQRMASQGIHIGKSVRHIAAMEMLYQVSRAWWTLVLVDELNDIIVDGQKYLSKERSRLENIRDEGGDSDPSDLLRLRIIEADFQSRIRQVHRNRAMASDALRMGMDDPMEVKLSATHQGLKALRFPLLPTAAYESLAVANHPRLMALRGGTQVKLEQIRLRKQQMLPDLLLVGRIAYTYVPALSLESESLAQNPTNPTQSGGGIALRWNLDVFRQLAQLEQARIEHRKSVNQQRAEKQKVRLEVRRLVREVNDAKAMIAVYHRAMKAARGWLRAESEMHKDGFQKHDEVLRAMDQYYRRRLAYLKSIHKYNVLVAELSRAVGMDVAKVKAVADSKPITQAVESP
jgi:outer membrane protein TolC